ncbi:MAG: leucine-rich repeat domain-containing protein [Lachnospiraceae bacterium]|nr:leucine-rich repeat domain-containing protein [Lachnospiraceae bacterium]
MPAHADIDPYAFYLAKNFDQPARPCKNADAGPGYGPVDGKETEEYAAPYACAGKPGITVLELKDIKSIGKYAFSACPDLEEVIIDAPGCAVGQNAFSACPKLKKVRMNVKEIGKACFAYSRQLEEVILSGVSVLPAQSFAGCCMLSRFEAKSVTRMGPGCFDECVRLESFDFSGIKQIGERAFERCDALRSVKLGAVECGYHAFADCASLGAVELSEDTVLGSGAFTGSTQIRSVVWNGESYEFSRFSDSLNRVDNPYPPRVREVIASVWSCFDIREGKQLAGYSRDASKVTIPADTEEIGQDVFRDHARLKEIEIPGSVRTFGSHAFSQTGWLAAQRAASDMVIVNGVLIDGATCSGDVELPVEVRRVASWCFAGNTAITSLKIPSERIGIENLAFRNCLNLKKITDWDGNTYGLKRVTDLKDKAYPELIQRIFSECINCFKLDDEGNLVESTGNITDLRFPEGIISIGDAVYKDCHLLETIVLSSDTAGIGRSAFENSKWLRSVTGAGAVESIGAQAFSGCQSLEEIDLSDALTQLGTRCFEHCVSLKEIHISDRLESIPSRAFFRCKALKRLVIPPSVMIIEDEAFAFCENLEEAYIPAGLELPDRVFAYCDRLSIHRT